MHAWETRPPRHQLLALLTNISTHPNGAAAMAATASGGGPSRLATSGGPASLPEILYGTAHQAVHMLVSATSWSTGQGLLEVRGPGRRGRTGGLGEGEHGEALVGRCMPCCDAPLHCSDCGALGKILVGFHSC